jgi:hypothetical protein
MEIMAQYGSFAQLGPEFCSLYGLLLLTVTVALAVYMKKPQKEDYED